MRIKIITFKHYDKITNVLIHDIQQLQFHQFLIFQLNYHKLQFFFYVKYQKNKPMND